jgi:hypothetical protein
VTAALQNAPEALTELEYTVLCLVDQGDVLSHRETHGWAPTITGKRQAWALAHLGSLGYLTYVRVASDVRRWVLTGHGEAALRQGCAPSTPPSPENR